MAIMYAIVCSFLWAGNTVAGKLLANTMPALAFAFSRYFIACICLLPFLSKSEFKTVKMRDLPPILFLGFTIVLLFNVFFFTALHYTSATTISLISAVNPILTLFVTTLIFRQVPKKAQLLAFLLSFAGAAMIISKGRIGFDILTGSIGEFLVLASTLVQIAYAFTAKKISHQFSPVFLSFAAGASGLLFLLPLVTNKELFVAFSSLTFIQWLSVLYIGSIGTAGGIYLYSVSLKNIGPATTSLLVFSTMPVFVFILSFFLLGEHATTWHILGGSLVISSLFIGLRHA